MSSDASRTSETLLDWLRDPANSAAWSEFALRYGAKIRDWCRSRGLQPADADDVTQEVLAGIHRKMKHFTYDRARGRFRDWLRKVTHNACSDFFKRNEAAKYRELLGDIPARDELDRAIEQQARGELLLAAMAELRQRARHTADWQLFYRLTFEGADAPSVARELGMKVTAVHTATSRMRRRLKESIEQLGGIGDDAALIP